MAASLENAKSLVSVVRDGLILLVLISLFAMPALVNDRLKRAGFVKASVAGFDWEATVEDNNEKLKAAAGTIDKLQEQVTKTETALQKSETARKEVAEQVAIALPDTDIATAAAEGPTIPTAQILQQNDKALQISTEQAKELRRQIISNDRLIASAATVRN